MKHRKKRSMGIVKKKRMALMIRFSVFLLSAAAVFSIVHLCYEIKNVTEQYSLFVAEERNKTDTLHSLESQLYKHQTCVFEHAVTSSDDEKLKLELEAQKLKSLMSAEVHELRQEMKDTKYDIRYKSLSSNIINYLYDSEEIFTMSHNGEYDKIDDYMENTILDYVNSLNENYDSFKNMLIDDMNTTRNDLDEQTKKIYGHAVIILLILIGFALVCQILSFRISHEMTNIDPLTLIHNYDYFCGYCENRKILRSFTDYVILSIDIKGFQYFNQQSGSSFGDAVLFEYAANLKKIISRRHGELVARVNGDSFIALIKTDRVAPITDYLRQIEFTIKTKDGPQKAVVYSRCGIFPLEKGVSFNDSVENSRTALKQAKKLTTSNCVWYSPKMSEKEKNSKEIIARFSEALKNREFVVYYQPKVDMTTNTLSGCEALVRWIRDGKLVPPFSFIPVLEEEGYITELDFYVFEKVCEDISVWISKGITPVRISSNFSKLHLKKKRFADDILEIISRYNIDVKYIEIELTESSGYEDFEAMTKFVNKMKSENIHTAIDDFGTGYSSLSLLKDLDIDVVKLDKSFLNGANTESQKNMIKNIIKMIRDLNHDVICEGVETEQQAAFLKSVECFFAQGYLYDKPLPHDDFEKRLVDPVYVPRKEVT